MSSFLMYRAINLSLFGRWRTVNGKYFWKKIPDNRSILVSMASTASKRKGVAANDKTAKKVASKKTKDAGKAKSKKKRVIPQGFPPPKRPLSGYMLFMNEMYSVLKLRPATRQEVIQMAKEIGQRWNELPELEKQVYKDRSAKLKAEYDEKMKIYSKSLKPKHVLEENKRRQSLKKKGVRIALLKLPGQPKAPETPFFRYLRHFRTTEPAKMFSRPSELVSAAGNFWRSMSAEEKESFAEGYDRAREAYKQELANFRQSLGIDSNVASRTTSQASASL